MKDDSINDTATACLCLYGGVVGIEVAAVVSAVVSHGISRFLGQGTFTCLLFHRSYEYSSQMLL